MKRFHHHINIFLSFAVLVFCFYSCNEKEQKAEFNETGLEKVVRANSKSKEVMQNAVKSGNTGQDIANWFPEVLGDYTIDDETIEVDKKNLPWAMAVYKHPTNSESNITLNVWDGQGPFAMAVNTMKTSSLDAEGEEDNGQMRKKVYERKGRKSSEMASKQTGLVHLIFEAEQRFYVTMRSNKNNLENMWQLADGLDFTSLVK
jgi:hypothetical protein